jgi:hypothetical protein
VKKTTAKKKKVIPGCVDVPGKQVTWVNESGHRFFGEVTKVFFRNIPHRKYPDSCLRELHKFMTIRMADDREFVVSARHEDLKKMKMIPEAEMDV